MVAAAELLTVGLVAPDAKLLTVGLVVCRNLRCGEWMGGGCLTWCALPLNLYLGPSSLVESVASAASATREVPIVDAKLLAVELVVVVAAAELLVARRGR